MKSRKTVIAAISVLLLSFSGVQVKAQFDQMFTQYMNNEMFINPAYAGAKGAMAFTILHRQQWVGFPGRPITTTFSINAPLMQSKMGIGLCYLNEKIGVLNRNLIYASYAYRVRTGTKSYLSFGIMGGVHLQLEKVTDLHTTSLNVDPTFSTNLPTVATPNFGFGIYFNTDKFYASFSIPRLLDDHVRFSPEGVYDKAVKFNYKSFTYYLAAGRLFTISDNFKLKPHMMVKMAINTPVEFDINLDALIRERLWLGLSYRSNADISAMAGLQITPAFLISYSYDYQVTGIRQHSGGSHEICLSYLFDYRGKKIISPRYF
jgi:type IX secretion system PorP/SprF family membrane protein